MFSDHLQPGSRTNREALNSPRVVTCTLPFSKVLVSSGESRFFFWRLSAAMWSLLFLLASLLGDGSDLAHRTEQVVFEPLLNHLAALIKAVYLDARELQSIARARHTEELALVGAPRRVAGYHLISFGHLVLYGVGEVGDGAAEPLDLLLYGVCSPDLSCLGVGVVADKVRVEHLVDQFRLALAEALLQKTPHLSLVLFRHRDLLSSLSLSVPRPYPSAGEAKNEVVEGPGPRERTS